jgi:murein DD-endopeptidase MepM/ murein hydrolase activator NlpD
LEKTKGIQVAPSEYQSQNYEPAYIKESEKYLDDMSQYAEESDVEETSQYQEPEISPPSDRTQAPSSQPSGLRDVLNRGRSEVSDAGKKLIKNATNQAKVAGEKAVKQGLSSLAKSAAPALAQIGLYAGIAAALFMGAIAWLATVIITVILWIIGFIVFVAVILFIINSGAYVVPPGEDLTIYGVPTPYQGDLPEECPSGWPITDSAYISQGAYAPGCSHSAFGGLEAIDLGGGPFNVVATHAGVVTEAGWDDCCGNYIKIGSTCNGLEFYSKYCHLASMSVSPGDSVAHGTTIGESDNTGTCTTGWHLHYAFHYASGASTGAGDGSYVDNPPFMDPPYLPVEIPRGCCDYCGVSF